MISRTEKIQWTFIVSGEMFKENFDLFNVIDDTYQADDVDDRDTVTLEHAIFIHYLDNLCRSLEAVISLRDRGVPCTVTQEELLHGRSLIQQLFNCVDELSS